MAQLLNLSVSGKIKTYNFIFDSPFIFNANNTTTTQIYNVSLNPSLFNSFQQPSCYLTFENPHIIVDVAINLCAAYNTNSTISRIRYATIQRSLSNGILLPVLGVEYFVNSLGSFPLASTFGNFLTQDMQGTNSFVHFKPMHLCDTSYLFHPFMITCHRENNLTAQSTLQLSGSFTFTFLEL